MKNPEPHGLYRVWYANWDAQVEPISQAEAVDDIESEMLLCSKAMLVTRGDLTVDETLNIVDSLRRLIEASSRTRMGGQVKFFMERPQDEN